MTLGGSDFPKTMAKMAEIRKQLPDHRTQTAAPASPVEVFPPGMALVSTGEKIDTFRIPSLVRVGTTKVLLALAEGRKFSGADFGPKAMCLRRSTDLGSTWGPLKAVVNHGNMSFMNPNTIWDAKTKTVVLQFTYVQVSVSLPLCPFSACKGQV